MLLTAPAAAAFTPQMTADSDDVIQSTLAFVRGHLEMDIAYISEFVDDRMVLRALNAPGLETDLHIGDSFPLQGSYCDLVARGHLREMSPDTSKEAISLTFSFTRELPVRSYVSVPICRADGSIYGTFCCVGREARPSLNTRDLEVVRAFASMAADQVNMQLNFEAIVQGKKDAIEAILNTRAFEIALQPILRLKDQGTAGYEALCRFSPDPYRAPNLWFDDAAEVGLLAALEVNVIEVALQILPDLPAHCYLAVNTSPATLATGKLSKLIAAVGGERVIFEVTEHTAIDDLDVLLMEIDRLRDLGARIAVDDAGAGYSGLQQIIRLRPDVIKLDMSLTQDVDKDVARRALASAMVQFAHDTNARVVAEGIETEAELRTLKSLGVEMGQGYHLGRPSLSSVVLKAFRSA